MGLKRVCLRMKAEYFTVLRRVSQCPLQYNASIPPWLPIEPRYICSRALSLVFDGGRHTLGAEELARDVEGLTSHNNNLLAVEELLGNGAGEATEQVPLAVDDLVALSARGPVLVLCCALEIAK